MFCPVMSGLVGAEEGAGETKLLGIAEAAGRILLGALRILASERDAALLGLDLAVLRSGPVANGPGNRPLIVTLLITVLPRSPAMNPVSRRVRR